MFRFKKFVFFLSLRCYSGLLKLANNNLIPTSSRKVKYSQVNSDVTLSSEVACSATKAILSFIFPYYLEGAIRFNPVSDHVVINTVYGRGFPVNLIIKLRFHGFSQLATPPNEPAYVITHLS